MVKNFDTGREAKRLLRQAKYNKRLADKHALLAQRLHAAAESLLGAKVSLNGQGAVKRVRGTSRADQIRRHIEKHGPATATDLVETMGFPAGTVYGCLRRNCVRDKRTKQWSLKAG